MRENAFCIVFHARWISQHLSPNGCSETVGEKNPSHMENNTKCIFSKVNIYQNFLDVVQMTQNALKNNIIVYTPQIKGVSLKISFTITHRVSGTYR